MINFNDEKFPTIEVIKKFDKKIKKIEMDIAKNQTIQEILKKENQKNIPEGAGSYFFYDTEKKKIVYVGISRTIKSRLQQHTNHKSSNSASLAYLMAKKDNKNADENIKKCFEKVNNVKNCRKEYQDKIKKFKVAFVKIENDFELALFEIYASIKLKSYWNSFKTH